MPTPSRRSHSLSDTERQDRLSGLCDALGATTTTYGHGHTQVRYCQRCNRMIQYSFGMLELRADCIVGSGGGRGEAVLLGMSFLHDFSDSTSC